MANASDNRPSVAADPGQPTAPYTAIGDVPPYFGNVTRGGPILAGFDFAFILVTAVMILGPLLLGAMTRAH